MDVAFCLDCTALMTLRLSETIKMIRSVLNVIPKDEGRFSLVKFRSPSDHPVTITSGFTPDRRLFEQSLADPLPSLTGDDRAVGEALQEVLNLQWRDQLGDTRRSADSLQDSNILLCPERVAILVTDGNPSGLFGQPVCVDAWEMSHCLHKRDIVLVIVGVGESIVECDDFYCALAQNTGGAYMPFVNAARLLPSAIAMVFVEQLTFHQALRRTAFDVVEENSSFRYAYMASRVRGMITECRTMSDIRSFFYNYRLGHRR